MRHLKTWQMDDFVVQSHTTAGEALSRARVKDALHLTKCVMTFFPASPQQRRLDFWTLCCPDYPPASVNFSTASFPFSYLPSAGVSQGSTRCLLSL